MKTVNLCIVKKDTKVYTIVLKQNGVAVNISGWQLYFTVKSDPNDADSSALLSKNVTFPSNTDSQNGIGYLSLTSIDTNIAVGEYYYDAKFIDTDFRQTFLTGKLVIVPSIRTS